MGLFNSIIDFAKEFPKKFPSINDDSNSQKINDDSVFGYNKKNIEQLFLFINNGVSDYSDNNTKEQLEKLNNKEIFEYLDPSKKKIEILEIVNYILAKAENEKVENIQIGSFYRTNSEGHKVGRSIDVNCSVKDWDTGDTAKKMVMFILNSLLELGDYSFGIGLPYQGNFLEPKIGKKFSTIPKPKIVDEGLKLIISKLEKKGSFLFPDNDNHLHIQIN